MSLLSARLERILSDENVQTQFVEHVFVKRKDDKLNCVLPRLRQK